MSECLIVAFPLCPYCGKSDVAFYLRHAMRKPHDPQLTLCFFTCGHCGGGVCAEIVTDKARYIEKNELRFEYLLHVFPEPQTPEAPRHTPDDIARAYKTAVKNFRMGDDADYEAAAMMARRCIELAVKAAGGNGGTLYSRIEDLTARQILTPTLKDWAHEIRDIGNDGAHGAEVTRDEAAQAVFFAEMLLTYLYTLPCMITERRQSK